MTREVKSLDVRFAEYDAKYPEIYELFARFAGQLLARGFVRYGARSVMEQIRWHYDTSGLRHDGFKYNDSYTSRYARKLAELDARYANFFRFRALRS